MIVALVGHSACAADPVPTVIVDIHALGVTRRTQGAPSGCAGRRNSAPSFDAGSERSRVRRGIDLWRASRTWIRDHVCVHPTELPHWASSAASRRLRCRRRLMRWDSPRVRSACACRRTACWRGSCSERPPKRSWARPAGAGGCRPDFHRALVPDAAACSPTSIATATARPWAARAHPGLRSASPRARN